MSKFTRIYFATLSVYSIFWVFAIWFFENSGTTIIKVLATIALSLIAIAGVFVVFQHEDKENSMITKERLEELIEQGATVYEIVYNYNGDIFCEYDLKNLPTYHKNNLEHFLYLHTVFETLEEAEWHKEFGCIERTERLELPTWEEFNKWDKSVKFYNNDTNYSMYVFVKNKNTNNCRIIIYADNGEQDWILFEQPLTKENYTLACRKCKELFLGGSDE